LLFSDSGYIMQFDIYPVKYVLHELNNNKDRLQLQRALYSIHIGKIAIIQLHWYDTRILDEILLDKRLKESGFSHFAGQIIFPRH